MSTLERFAAIIREVLDEEDLVVTRDTTAEDAEDWDSLGHVQIVVAVEKEFDIQFTMDELERMVATGTVGAAVDIVDAKVSG